MHLNVDSPIEDGLLLVGVPFRQGECPPRQRLALLTGAGQELPAWWTPRALWPDGSRKWIWLHARVPAGTTKLSLQATEQEPAAHESRVHIEGQELTFEDKGFRFAASPSIFSLEAGGDRIEVQDEPDVFEPEAKSDFSSAYFQILEDSPIAPLIRLCHPVEEGVRKEYLFRVDPALQCVHWTRRVSLMSGPRHELRSMAARLGSTPGQWCLPDFQSHHTLRVHLPHRMQLGHDPETDGHPDAFMAAAGEAVRLDKGWQRAPLALHAGSADGMIEFYPAACAPLVVLQGTSFRHEVRLAVGADAEAAVRSEVRWSWDSEAAAGSGAFGPLIPRGEEVKRLFPGFDKAFEMAIDHCRPTQLDSPDEPEEGPPGDLADETTHDVEFFGLQHYGDWPMKRGAYGSSNRIYCDNEYDVAYALFQQFARTGRWEILDLARHSAMHMTDVDYCVHTGDLRYHGYYDTAEDHQGARPTRRELGHVWTDGFWLLHLVLGDPFARDAAIGLTELLCEDFAGDDDDVIRRHFTGCERAVGWPMVAMCATAEITDDPEVLETMEHMSQYVARYMADPDAEFEGIKTISGQSIQWWRCAALDGSKPFMLGVLMEGLERYHRLSGSPAARDALIAIAEFLRDVMWAPLAGAFIYELNAYNRGHRGLFPHYINLIVTRGLAYAYDLTGDESFRKLTADAAYGGLWTVFETTGGKEIGMVGRTSGATAAYMMDWWKRDQDALAAAQPSSEGVAFEFDGRPAELLAQSALLRVDGEPEYDSDEALICLDESFAICQIPHPWNTDCGRVALDHAPNSTIEWDRGGNPHPGWGLFHLCDEEFMASAITVMQFYDSLHVRFYDRHRKIIEVLETKVNGWQAGQRRTIEFEWDPQDAVLRMNGEEAHRIRLPRRLSGAFRKLYLGCKPGNWKGKGKLYRVGIRVRLCS